MRRSITTFISGVRERNLVSRASLTGTAKEPVFAEGYESAFGPTSIFQNWLELDNSVSVHTPNQKVTKKEALEREILDLEGHGNCDLKRWLELF